MFRTLLAASILVCLFSNKAFADIKLTRFISADPSFKGQACFGQVVSHEQGIPRDVNNLGSLDSKYCQPLDEPVSPALIYQALQLDLSNADLVNESISESDQAVRVLPPIQFTDQQLVDGERLIIGVGFNYVEHLEETGDYSGDAPLLLFSKPVKPTGPYAPVIAGPSSEVLLDYEVELAMVLLTDIDLKQPLSPQQLYPNVAFALANDLSDRVPIITSPKFGYTQGKSDPGYLPLGPWLRLGREGFADDNGDWQIDASISLGVNKSATGEFILEQDASLLQMRFDPYQIIQIMAERYQTGERVCMRDNVGKPHQVIPNDGVIPAGSILLTGTAGGTAIQAPSIWKKIGLFFEGGFSIDNARKVFLQEQFVGRDKLGYLQHQDVVSANIQGLGQQQFEVQMDNSRMSDQRPSPGCN